MNWLDKPRSKGAHKEFTRDVRTSVTRGIEPETPAKAAVVEVAVMRRSAEVGEMVDRALLYQAEGMERSENYKHAGYPDVGAAIKEALKHIKRHSSEYSELSFLAETLIPYLRENRLPVPQELFQAGSVSKSRRASSYLRPLFAADSPQLKVIVKRVIKDICNPKVTNVEFRQRYTYRPKAKPKAYVLGKKGEGLLVLPFNSVEERDSLTRALNGRVTWAGFVSQKVAGFLRQRLGVTA